MLDRGFNDAVSARAAARAAPPPSVGSTPAVLAALAAVYEAACDERLWPQALDRLAAVCGVGGAAIVLIHGRSRQRVVLARGIPEAELHGREPARFAAGVPAHETAEPAGAASGRWLTAPLPLDAPDSACLHLRANIRRHGYDAHAGRQMLDSLAPYVAGALRIALERAREAAAHARQAQEADALPLGRLLLGVRDQVLQLNRPARRILDAADGLILAENRLLARSSGDEALLRQALQQARERGERSMLSIHRRHGRMPYAARIAPAPAASGSIFAECEPMLEVLVVSHDGSAADMAFAAACWPELSRVERRVLERLLLGDGIDQCVEHLRVARGTAKLHVEHIFRKTGIRRRSELLRLSLLPFVAALPCSAPAEAERPPAARSVSGGEVGDSPAGTVPG